jgi:hypothetical protein
VWRSMVTALIQQLLWTVLCLCSYLINASKHFLHVASIRHTCYLPLAGDLSSEYGRRDDVKLFQLLSAFCWPHSSKTMVVHVLWHNHCAVTLWYPTVWNLSARWSVQKRKAPAYMWVDSERLVGYIRSCKVDMEHSINCSWTKVQAGGLC